MIDLHSHTTASDGTLTPSELIELAGATGLEALAITDHDTFGGYREAVPLADGAPFELVCAIELSARIDKNGRPGSAHMLAYFLSGPPTDTFHQWLEGIQANRRERNGRLAARLQSLGVDVTLDEVEQIGRQMTGRAHFARVLADKGYVASRQEAFTRYLGEDGEAYTPRDAAGVAETVAHVREAGGLPVLAHPIRLGIRPPDAEEALIADFVDHGLQGLEVWHSDQSAADSARYAALAERYNLIPTGGSDFHGDLKPKIRLGHGPGHLNIPLAVLDRMKNRGHLP